MCKILFLTNVIRRIGMMQQTLDRLKQEGKIDTACACRWITDNTQWDNKWQQELDDSAFVLMKWMGSGLDTPFLQKCLHYLKQKHIPFYIDASGSKEGEVSQAVPVDIIAFIKQYALYGGEQNYYNLWLYLQQLVTKGEEQIPSPDPIHWTGIFHPRAQVDINTNNSALNIKGDINANGGNITVDSGKATGTIESNVTASNGGNVEISLNDKKSTLTGAYNVDADSSIVMNIANGSTWNLTDDEDEASGMSLMRMAKAPAATAKGLTLNGGKTEAETGFINLQKRTKDVKIANYSGWETFIYSHEGAGDKVSDYKSGDTIIDKAAKGSGVILSTDNSGINMKDKNSVEATLKALAQKVTYNDHEANGDNLTGKVQIAGGLTASSKSQNIGTLHWDENGKGQYNLDSVNWNQIIEGDYETFVMKGVRSAATTSLHTWRDNMQDTYTGADMADEDGMFAKALGGKTSSDVKGLKDSNTYYGVQVGYDKAAANGWHTGVAFDYRNGDSNYLLGGKGDNQMYSLGVYGVKNFENDAFLRVAAKVGRVENEYDVYNEIRSLKLNGDYKANAYGLTMEYGKTFGDEEAYFTPKAQLTWSQVGSKDYTAHTENATMQVAQDSYSSFVGRLGFEAGVKSEKGRVYAGLFAAHEFNGDISASYFANDGDRKHTSFDGEETWMEMKLGGTYDFSNNAHLYADIAKDFNGNFERKWKMNVGLRFEF